MADFTFYTNPMSRGQIARWALHEAGADYETILVDFANKSEDFLRVNSMGKVPTLIHHLGGKNHIVTEAAAICTYLAHASAPELAPRQDEAADYYRWMFFAAGPVEQAVLAKTMGWSVPKEREGMAGFGSFERTIETLTEAVTGRDYICGDRFTMADVYVGSQVDWGLIFQSIPESPPLLAYAERLRERAAYKEAKAIDTKLIEAAQ